MSDPHEPHGKKLKKLQQLLKNRHTRDINQLADQQARERDLEQEREEGLRAAAQASSRAAEKKPGNTVWSAQLQEIRDKNTGRKRMATERWNRFAGTEGGGGRGL